MDSTMIDIYVRDDLLHVRKYEWIRTRSLKGLLDSFYAAHKRQVRGYIYMHKEERVTNQDTPASLQMSRGGWIDAISVPHAYREKNTEELDPATQSEFDDRALAAKQNFNIKIEYGKGESLNIWHPREEPMTTLVHDIAYRMGYSDNQEANLLVYLNEKRINPLHSPNVCGVWEGAQIDIYPYAQSG
ncbi:hypothetical protein BWQ96_09625 [Gracilariopsis chorda]|uniref:Uncharacterized protein n=1 Tax=Gracilariopsis chorda TaxID=448386 RepID=A0A2V3IHQ6_9FLOR|nr:hypothetical protein BWQ96_10902 [Gracilariopsis chorda]PXF40670.1 hypothetical protein BWQ96_09625 [Gracilariopsis chorda]|eukprot:PXF39411.1 hypothetical protein BWQ96_10902 [Gracilariopsis chorda]